MVSNPYQRAVPKAYHKTAGLDAYVSRVVEVRGSCDRLVRRGTPPVAIDESAVSRVRQDDHIVTILVPRTRSPHLFNAVVNLSEALITGVRLHRFVTAFKAYESLVAQPPLPLAAIRHAITHPESVLSRPKTLAALQDLFGGTRIDLDTPQHRRVFYRELGQLLRAIDVAIAEAISSGEHPWSAVPRGYHPTVAAYARWFA